MESIILNHKKYSYSVVRKSISSLRLRLKSSHSFIVSCPRLTPKFVITQFINKNSSWITSHSQKIPPKKSIKNLNHISVLDKTYQLIFIPTSRDSVIIYPDTQKIYANVSSDSNSHIKQILETKLRPFALSLIKNELSLLKKYCLPAGLTEFSPCTIKCNGVDEFKMSLSNIDITIVR